MNATNRITVCNDFTFFGMTNWFADMSAKELLFHPDDDPSELVRIVDNTPTFDRNEVRQLRKIISRMFAENGDEVYEAAYPEFMKCMNIKLDT